MAKISKGKLAELCVNDITVIRDILTDQGFQYAIDFDDLIERINLLRGPAKSTMGGGAQVVRTPRAFIRLLELRLGITFGFDLAAIAENAVAPRYFGPCPGAVAQDALKEDWTTVCGPDNWAFNNPEYAYVLPWVRKAQLDSYRGARLVQLLKASLGSKWFFEQVYQRRCRVLKMYGRLPFEGYEGCGANFDTIVIVWDGMPYREETWDWRADMAELGLSL